MLTLLTGPSQSDLERSLVQSVHRLKIDDSTVPLAVIVPSEVVRRRVQWVLSAEWRLALFDVSVLTFHQLALRLQAERQVIHGSNGETDSLEVVDERLYEWMVPGLQVESEGMAEPIRAASRSKGMRQALWRTIRDLQEGQVDPAVALRAVQEGLFDESGRDRLTQVFSLQGALQAWSRQVKIGLPDDMAESVISWVPCSPLLARLGHVFYYGFYDLTQVQLSFMEEIIRTQSVTLLFPLGDGPDFQFARRFLDRYLLRGSVNHRRLERENEGASSPLSRLPVPLTQIASAVGEKGEGLFTAKTILQLVEAQGYAFHEIGVVARSLEPYGTALSDIFRVHRIPFVTTATRPMLEEPLAAVWWQLAGLNLDDFPAQSMVNILTSPFYRWVEEGSPSMADQAHWWRRLIHFARIIRGVADWDRLCQLACDGTFLQEAYNQKILPSDIGMEEVRAFTAEGRRLIQEAGRSSDSGTVADWMDRFERLLSLHLYSPEDLALRKDMVADEERFFRLAESFERFRNVFRQWHRLAGMISEQMWVERFREMLEKSQLPVMGQSEVGVRVLDAMSARGSGFRALFVLGLNDQIFPRIVREDALLRDRDRRVLAESLGFKIDEKLSGFDEERLLFALLRQSARDRLYLLYQRSDDQGRSLIPSPLLSADFAGRDASGTPTIHLPLSLVERQALPLFSCETDTLEEARIGLLLRKQNLPSEMVDEIPWKTILDHGLAVSVVLESSTSRAGIFDGLVGGEHPHWRNLQSAGMTPTSFERYVLCPFRYWMQEVLGTRETRESASRELPVRVWGQVGHEVLRAVYRKLNESHWPLTAMAPQNRTAVVQTVIPQVFSRFSLWYGEGFGLVRQEMLRRMSDAVEALIRQDLEDYEGQGWLPVAYEVEGSGYLPLASGSHKDMVPIRGRMDRLDASRNGGRLRVVDYKFSWSRALRSGPPDLTVEAGQGKRLQPPLYALMSNFRGWNSEATQRTDRPPVQEVLLRFLQPFRLPPVDHAIFPGEQWSGETGELLRRTFGQWLHGIREGKFFILTGVHCRECAWAGACRSQHHPSWSRVQTLAAAREFRALKKQRIVYE